MGGGQFVTWQYIIIERLNNLSKVIYLLSGEARISTTNHLTLKISILNHQVSLLLWPQHQEATWCHEDAVELPFSGCMKWMDLPGLTSLSMVLTHTPFILGLCCVWFPFPISSPVPRQLLRFQPSHLHSSHQGEEKKVHPSFQENFLESADTISAEHTTVQSLVTWYTQLQVMLGDLGFS